MAIDFPNSPLQGNTYDYLGVRYTYVDTGGGTGFWKVNTPGSVGAASAVEVDSGVVQTKYITPFAMEGSKFKEALDNTGTSASRDIGSAAGDVAEVGEFGIGVGQNGINIDADTRTTPSKERWGTGSTNTGADGNTFLVDITSGSSTGYPNQIIKQLASGPYLGRTYERFSTDSGATWSVWQELGGLLEYGTNSNGSYWKYLDGLLVSAQSGIQGDTLGNSSGSAGFTDDTTATFPHSYITTPFVIASSQRVGANVIARNATPTSVSMQFFLLANSTSDMTYLAIGNWK
jgi:hypothetical protein